MFSYRMNKEKAQRKSGCMFNDATARVSSPACAAVPASRT
jgi:hypothetical protein